MAKILFILGESGSGKTTLEKHLVDQYGFKMFDKLSSRAIRPDDSGYIHFPAKEITDMYVDGLVHECIKYDGNIYAMRIPTDTSPEDKFIVVLVEAGFQQFIDMNIEDQNEIASVFLLSNKCEEHMRKRGDSEESIDKRMKLNKRMIRYRGRHKEIQGETLDLVEQLKKNYPSFF